MLTNTDTLILPTDKPGTIVQCECGETLTPSGKCQNVGSCEHADLAAAQGSRRETLKSRVSAWTIRGNID